MKPILSIIVPAHNSHTTLPRLLSSIATQDIASETIIVDDCSDEPYDALITSFRKQGMNIRSIRCPQRVFTKEARLIGIAAAQAEILTFADADDIFYGTEGLNTVVRLFQKHTPDLLHFSTMDMHAEFAKEILWLSPLQEELLGWDIIQKFAILFSKFNIWGKLYRRSIWQHVLAQAHIFPVQRYCEDMYLFFLYVLHSKKYFGTPTPAYGYYYIPESAYERALGRMLASDTIRKNFIPYARQCACPEAIVTILDENMAKHTALQATRYLKDFSLTHGNSDHDQTFFANALDQIPIKELLRILIESNALLARSITNTLGLTGRISG